jgi:hypothetical protein
VGRIDLLALVDLEGEVLDPDAVVPVLATIGWADTKSAPAHRVLQVDDLLGAAIGGISHPVGPPERVEQVGVESQ